MLVAVDGTPLLGERTGIGRYVAGLFDGFAALPDVPDLDVVAFTRSTARPPLPVGTWTGRRVPARLLHEAWGRLPFPPIEALAGRVDVVHATNFVLPPRRRAAGVASVHDLAFLLHADTVTPAVARLRALVPRLLRTADAVITDSATVADLVAEHLPVDRSRIHAIPLGLDPAWASPPAADPAALGLPSSYVLFVGSREPRKDLATLVGALALLGSDAPPLVLAGPAGWGPEVDLGGAIRLGYLTDEQLRTVVAGADVLALPSRDEGFGLTALEALACGTAVVASDLPVLREVLGDQAAYAAVGDPEAFADALGKPVGTPESRRAHAAPFTWRACAERTLEVYTSVTR